MRNVKGLAAGTLLAVAAIVATGYGVLTNQEPEHVALADSSPAPAVSVQAAPPSPEVAPAQLSRAPASDTSAQRGSSEDRLRELVQQSTGTVCETPNGSCTVSPRPINSPCKCGRYVGQVVR